jgi:hypothetical protein
MRYQPQIVLALRVAAFATIWLGAGTGAFAQDAVLLTIAGGRVSLVARDVPVSRVLDEWARRGQTRIEGAVPTERITLELNGVPEHEALAVLLRSAGGYVAISRAVPLGDDSRFERVVVMRSGATGVTEQAPPSAAAVVPVTPARAARPIPTGTAGVGRLVDEHGIPVPDDQEDAPYRPPSTPHAVDAAPQPRQAQPPPGSPAPGMVVPQRPIAPTPQR